jgi:hypothetical protein
MSALVRTSDGPSLEHGAPFKGIDHDHGSDWGHLKKQSTCAGAE